MMKSKSCGPKKGHFLAHCSYWPELGPISSPARPLLLQFAYKMWTLKMEATYRSEMSVPAYRTTWYHNLEHYSILPAIFTHNLCSNWSSYKFFSLLNHYSSQYLGHWTFPRSDTKNTTFRRRAASILLKEAGLNKGSQWIDGYIMSKALRLLRVSVQLLFQLRKSGVSITNLYPFLPNETKNKLKLNLYTFCNV
jgi:hypothetical protein